MPSFSRPSVSNDNPYSELLFKTLKYRPQYPLRHFADVTEARQWVTELVKWYNHEHCYSAIGFVTPAQRHEGLDEQLLTNRRAVYEAAYAKNPERWSGILGTGKEPKKFILTLIKQKKIKQKIKIFK